MLTDRVQRWRNDGAIDWPKPLTLAWGMLPTGTAIPGGSDSTKNKQIIQ